MRTWLLVLACLCGVSIRAGDNPIRRLEGHDNVCTTWATKHDKKVVWITVLHCVQDDNENVVWEDYTINGEPAWLRAVSAQLAMLDGPTATDPFTISRNDPDYGDAVAVRGLPYGGPFVFLRGSVAGFYHLKRYASASVIYQIPSASGESGSPIFNASGDVVGAIEGASCTADGWHGFCPVSFGVTRQELWNFIRGN